jgi:hypothetical protein
MSGHVTGNLITGTNGIVLYQTGTALMGEVEVTGNILTGSGADIDVSRAGTFSATNHKGVTVSKNKVSVGHISVNGMNQVLVSDNVIYSGYLSTVVGGAGMTTANSIRILSNDVLNSTTHGIVLSVSGTALSDFEVAGGKVYNAQGHGVYVLMASSATAKWGRIRGVLALDNSQDTTNTYSGIAFGGVSGCAVTETRVHDNTAISTVAGKKHKYGVAEVAGGSDDYNWIYNNMVKGWGTDDILKSGNNSVGSSSNNFDLGTGV